MVARKQTPEGKRVTMGVKFSEPEAEEIDAARGHMNRSEWIRKVCLAAARPPGLHPLPAESEPPQTMPPQARRHGRARRPSRPPAPTVSPSVPAARRAGGPRPDRAEVCVPASWLATRDLPLDSLERFPGNARRGNTAEIRKSIKRHGQYRAIVVRQHDGGLTILAGNHTADALQAEGHETARCELIECSDNEARRIAVADNRLAELGGYDDDALVELLSYLDDDYEGTGWTEEDVRKLIDVPDFEPEDESPRLDELEPRFCPKCGYDTANDPEALKVRPG